MLPDGPNPTQVQFVPPHKLARPPAPLVLLHDGGGTVFAYFMLDSLGRDVWAVHNPNYFDGRPWPGGIDAMARHYIGLVSEAGISGAILLGGWSLGGYLALAMARLLADDPCASISVAGVLMMDSPHHVARSSLAASTSKANLRSVPHLVRTALDNCDAMLQDWQLPSWDGPSGGANSVHLSVAGRRFTLPPGSALYKRVGGAWEPMDSQPSQHTSSSARSPISPPPGVLIRCTRPAEKHEGSGPAPCMVDVHRDDKLLGWEGNYPHFIKAVIDVDSDHYALFDMSDQSKLRNLTAQVNAGLEILDSLR